MGNADALSQLPQPVTTDKDCLPGDHIQLLNHISATTTNTATICRYTNTDPVLSQVRNFILEGWPTTKLEEPFQPCCRRKTELSILEGCIVWGSRVVIPPPATASVIEELHDSHLGASKMKSLARAYVWWPKLDSDIENVARTCTTCQQNSVLPSKATVHPWEWFSQPWRVVCTWILQVLS